MKKILVVDDSALMRRVLCDIINDDERFHVEDRATNGLEAFDLLSRKTYDAVILDVNMPKMDGLELLRELQKYKIPAKVMMASTDTREGAQTTLDALELGALDFIHKPDNAVSCRTNDFQTHFLEVLEAIADAKPLLLGNGETSKAKKLQKPERQERSGKPEKAGKQEGRLKPDETKPEDERRAAAGQAEGKPTAAQQAEKQQTEKPQTRENAQQQKAAAAPKQPVEQETAQPQPEVSAAAKLVQKHRSQAGGKKVVAIASSTGGPKALQSVIPLLPENLQAPVLIVQHMPKGFTASLAERLDALSRLTVKEAAEGDVLENGCVYLAMGGMHMNVVTQQDGRAVIHYTDEPHREGVKPCANYMFESLQKSRYDEVICVVMTGMGADGTQGISHLKVAKKTYVITQDKDSCAVYGMPKSATEAGLTDSTVPLNRIAEEIILNAGVK